MFPTRLYIYPAFFCHLAPTQILSRQHCFLFATCSAYVERGSRRCTLARPKTYLVQSILLSQMPIEHRSAVSEDRHPVSILKYTKAERIQLEYFHNVFLRLPAIASAPGPHFYETDYLSRSPPTTTPPPSHSLAPSPNAGLVADCFHPQSIF